VQLPSLSTWHGMCLGLDHSERQAALLNLKGLRVAVREDQGKGHKPLSRRVHSTQPLQGHQVG